jgi:hypothetical protein
VGEVVCKSVFGKEKKNLQTAMKLVMTMWQKGPSRLLRQRSEEIKRYYQQLLAIQLPFYHPCHFINLACHGRMDLPKPRK